MTQGRRRQCGEGLGGAVERAMGRKGDLCNTFHTKHTLEKQTKQTESPSQAQQRGLIGETTLGNQDGVSRSLLTHVPSGGRRV